MVIISTDDGRSVGLGDRAPGTLRELEVTAVVTAKLMVADRVAEISLRRADGEEWPVWAPGAHIDLLLPDAGARQYSLCGAEADRTLLRVGVLREVDGRGGSVWIHDVLAVGDEIVVRGPRNAFQLEEHPSYVFVAGGIGITPILTMIRHVSQSGLPWVLHYGGRTRTSMAFVDELQTLRGGRVELYPRDETARMPLSRILGAPSDTAGVYACGPAPLLSAVTGFRDSWPSAAIRIERFEPADAIDTSGDRPIEVSLAMSGIDLEVAADETILEAVEKHGVAVLSSCRVGTCGTCETPVLQGEPEHRDSVLDDEERASNECIMICVSRARSRRLVLDL
ncbi:PDR/VanB family oxidoreductase [uncultured Amnibacterium sp.]|uniref:PDR/VanB family oxidoreductase n=1 Tax=uncultured Amnibacterium sp. TaxID=1631851 RepID=UPI0035CCA27D